MSRNIFGTVALLAVLAVGRTADAAIVFSNPFPTSPQGGYCSPCQAIVDGGPDYRVFDRFTLSSAATLDAAEVAIHDISSPFADDIMVTIFNATYTVTLYSAVFNNTQYTRTDPLQAPSPGNSYPFIKFDLPGIALAAGTYGISFFGQGITRFGLPGTFVDGSAHQIIVSNNQTINTNFDIGFRLFDEDVTPAPAPGALALFGLGLLGFGAARRRR